MPLHVQPPQRVFATESARIAWETTLAAEEIATTMPPEGAPLDVRPITFDPEHEQRGLQAIFAVGTVIGADDDAL